MSAYRDNAVVVDDATPLPKTRRVGRVLGSLLVIAIGAFFSWAMFSVAAIPIMTCSLMMAYMILTRYSPADDARRRALAESKADAWMRGQDVIRSR